MSAVRKWLGIFVLVAGLSTIVAANGVQDVSGVVRRAGQAFVEGDYPTALRFLKKAYAIYPNANILWNMARCYEEMGNYGKALRAYRVYVGMNLPQKAKKEGRRRISLVRQKWGSRLEGRAEDARIKGDFRKALGLYKQVYSLIKDPVDLWKMAKLHHKTGELDTALALLDRFLGMKIGPDEAAAARQEMAIIKLELQKQRVKQAKKEAYAGHYGVAMDLLKSGYSLRSDPAVKLEIARLDERMGDKSAALKEYRVLLKSTVGEVRQAAEKRLFALTGKASAQKAAVLEQAAHVKGKKIRMASYIVGGTAVAMMVAGGVLTFLSGQDFDSLEGAARDAGGNVVGMSQSRAASLQSSARMKQKLSWAMYGIGGAAVVTSVVLFFTGRSMSHAGFVAIPVKGGALVGIHGDF